MGGQIDRAAVRVKVPGRGRRIDVIRDEPHEAHREERPAEPLDGLLRGADVEVDRERDGAEEERTVGDGAEAIRPVLRVGLEPVVHRPARASEEGRVEGPEIAHVHAAGRQPDVAHVPHGVVREPQQRDRVDREEEASGPFARVRDGGHDPHQGHLLPAHLARGQPRQPPEHEGERQQPTGAGPESSHVGERGAHHGVRQSFRTFTASKTSRRMAMALPAVSRSRVSAGWIRKLGE